MASQTQQAMLEKITSAPGFIAALDQSGGSTPKALKLYGIDETSYQNDGEMFDLVHEMRTRIITSEVFNGDRILGAILFENTLDRDIEGLPTSQYLWQKKHIVPFLKVDKGLADEADGVQQMKPISGLDALLEKANQKDVFGTKMRSVIKMANPQGIKAVTEQQFAIGRQILAAGLVPIIEPEVDIHSPQKADAEALLKQEILTQLNLLDDDQLVMLKLTLPSKANFYRELIEHPRVIKVVALSGGYSREDANTKLAENNGMIASFSRALTEGISAQQSQAEFDATLHEAIDGIFRASGT
ncbi:fructose bisphosphate aldolase [Alteromonas aestuariivivens]|uniref:fructose-bisphosphate aldolase n=1 Tax=Alteromonas aestuariivivens TaxID=1938339 RepID=A0A3D8MD89_9ALTE|nr:fructose bisphosphate aldolase [Alteromonas aestuariivivens]RDV28143.1 fructose bisphosphate aldolase [Alteromonas aestuariivivens]